MRSAGVEGVPSDHQVTNLKALKTTIGDYATQDRFSLKNKVRRHLLLLVIWNHFNFSGHELTFWRLTTWEYCSPCSSHYRHSWISNHCWFPRTASCTCEFWCHLLASSQLINIVALGGRRIQGTINTYLLVSARCSYWYVAWRRWIQGMGK